MMNKFNKILGFTLFISMVAPVQAMLGGKGFGKTPFGGLRNVVQSEEELVFNVQNVQKQDILGRTKAESSGSSVASPDSPNTQADKIFDEVLRRNELGLDDSATSSADEKVASPSVAKAPVASEPSVVPSQPDLLEKEVKEGPIVLANDEVAPAASASINPLEDCPKIAKDCDVESFADADDVASEDEKVSLEVSTNAEDLTQEEVVENKTAEELGTTSGADTAAIQDAQVEDILESSQLQEQKNPESVVNNGANTEDTDIAATQDAQVEKIFESNQSQEQRNPESVAKNPVRPAAQNEPAKFYTPALKAAKQVPGYFTANYLKKDNGRDMKLENLRQNKMNLFITFVLYAATASAVGGIAYTIANWFKKTDKPAKLKAVRAKQAKVVAPRA